MAEREKSYLGREDAINIQRPIYLQEQLDDEFSYSIEAYSVIKRFKRRFLNYSCFYYTTSFIPCIKWLCPYDYRNNLLGDVIAGFTVGIIQVSQGIGHAMHAKIVPSVGLYTSLYPVLIYVIFGTSYHISIGAYTVASILLKPIIARNHDQYPTEEITSAVSFSVGVSMIILFCIRAGTLTSILSNMLVSGYTCATAFNVLSVSLCAIFGVKKTLPEKYVTEFETIWHVFVSLPEANFLTIVISSITFFILILNMLLFKPWLRKKTKILFPMEILVVTVGSSCSYFFDFHGKFNVTIVDSIPKGFKAPEIPNFSLIVQIYVDSLPITFVTYFLTMAIAIMLAIQGNTKVNGNQELLALGLCNIVGSFFGCMPVCVAVSRSVIQFESGGKTQMVSIIACILLVFILLWLAPLFEPLPKAVIYVLIVFAMFKLMIQVIDAKKYWYLIKWEFTIWIVTFLTTLIFDFRLGIYVGMAISVLTLFLFGYYPHTCIVGNVPNTDLYISLKHYKHVKLYSGIIIFRFCGSLNFSTQTYFLNSIWKIIGFEPSKLLRQAERTGQRPQIDLKCLIIDLAPIVFLDSVGVLTLRELEVILEILEVKLYLATCSSQVYEVFQKVNNYFKKENYFILFPSVHDAYLYELNDIKNDK